MEIEQLRRAIEWRVHLLRRAVRDVPPRLAVKRTDLELLSSAGYPIAARLTRPASAGPLPGVLVSPAIHHGRDELDRYVSMVTAREIARLGYAVLTYDPAGRGASWGEEDFGGPEQQDDLRVAFLALANTPGVASVGVLSLSYGIVAAAGALARFGDELDCRWLVDWEGPSDREIITTGGTRLVPAAGHSLEDEGYWPPREPVRHLNAVRCPYVRLQALPDHAQAAEHRHAERMMRAALSGRSAWSQLNDHPREQLPPRPVWLAPGPLAANAAILRKLGDLR